MFTTIVDLCVISVNVRVIVKIFRYSTTKKDFILPKYIPDKLGFELVQILNTKTRWNCLVFMLERLLGLKGIKKLVI